MNKKKTLATIALAGSALGTIIPAANAAPAAPEAPAAAAAGTECPSADEFRLSAPSHTEVGGNLLDKQITYGAYWDGGNLPAGTTANLSAGPAQVTLLNGETYTAPVVAGGNISGVFPGGGAAFAPSFRLPGSAASLVHDKTDDQHVTSISYPVTVTGNFGTCTYTVHGESTSKFNVTSMTLTDNK